MIHKDGLRSGILLFLLALAGCGTPPPGMDAAGPSAALKPASAGLPEGGVNPEQVARGRKLVLTRDCAGCHGDQGEGVPGAYPPLAGNRAVTLDPPANLVRIVLGGGFPPATAGNPRPYGMPPFATALGDSDIAAVLTMIRRSWGNSGTPVTTGDVHRYRGGTG